MTCVALVEKRNKVDRFLIIRELELDTLVQISVFRTSPREKENKHFPQVIRIIVL